MLTRTLLVIHVRSGDQLPKTDRLSEIDPYIRVRFGNRLARTVALKDCPAPVWDQVMLLPIEVDLSAPQGPLSIELWDAEVIDDRAVALAQVDIGDALRAAGQPWPVALEVLERFQKRARGVPTIDLTFSYLVDFPTLQERLEQSRPGFITDDVRRHFTVPLFEFGAGAHLRIAYPTGADRAMSLALLLEPQAAEDHYDFIVQGRALYQVSRTLHAPPIAVDGLTIAREVRVDDLSLVDDLERVGVLWSRRQHLGSVPAAAPLIERGMQGSVGFQSVVDAIGHLGDVRVNHDERSIYVPYQRAYLCIDFDEGDVDLSLHGPRREDADGLYLDLTYPGPCVTRRHLHDVPADYLGRAGMVSCIALDDLPLGTTLNHVTIEHYRLSPPTVWSLLELIPLRGA